VIGAGVTVHEVLKAYEELKKEGIFIRVIDLYSVKPIDETTLREASTATEAIITVEDHYAEGGIGEAVRSALAALPVPLHSLAVRKKPRSGKPEELLDDQEISQRAILRKVKELL
jgi:transketolase